MLANYKCSYLKVYKYSKKMGCAQSSGNIARLKLGLSHRECYYSLLTQDDQTYIDTGKQKLKYQVQWSEDFLQHHLNNESPLSSFANSHKIRARQIIEHYIFKDTIKNKSAGMLSPGKLTEFALRAWFQRTFQELLTKAQRRFFEEDRPYKEIKKQLAEQYVFEIYQMSCFLNAGFRKYSSAEEHVQFSLAPLLLNSDSALYFILESLQERYPLVANEDNLTFPEVEEMKSALNLLSLIDSKCYADLDNYNFQTTMDDLKALIDEANQLYPDFKSDMQDIFGEVQTDCKVKWQIQENQKAYNASAIRRVFIKWSETMIERVPEVCTLNEFMDFVRSKKEMADQFIFNGTVTPTTHQQVINKLSELLQSIKCHPGTKNPRQQFGLFLYDLLRSKTTRKTAGEVIQLLQKLKGIKVTSTGKRLQVIRVKNRFKKPTRDLLINFRYGEYLVAEVQLCVDVAHSSAKINKQIKFRHMLYELERGLFGPTFEMIMQYEDQSRNDIVVKMQTAGPMRFRLVGEEVAKVMKQAGRICPQRHEMIAVVGDIFAEDRMPDFMLEGVEKMATCDFCFQKFSVHKQYHYCYYCSIFYCLKCINAYKASDRQKMKISCLQHSFVPQIDSSETLAHLCQTKKSIIMIAIKPTAIQSKLFLDQVVYLLKAYQSHDKPIPNIYALDLANEQVQGIVQKYRIDRTPTTIVLDQGQTPQVTLVGCTFSDIQQLIEISHRIANGLPKGLKIKCLQCQEQMAEGESKQKCQVCMDTNKIETVADILKNIGGSIRDFVCRQGHLRCKYCAYLSSNAPSFYTDYTGRSYLSSRVIKKPAKCKKGHVMDLIPVNGSNSYLCSKCQKIITENDENEQIGCCFECGEFRCIECKDSQKINLLSRKKQQFFNYVEVVSHFAQNKLEQGYPCGCGKYFWRVYQSLKIDKKKFRFRQFFGLGGVVWRCYLCKKEESKLRLHLACFYCSFAETIEGKPSHTQICLACAMKSGLIGKPQHRTITKKQSTNLKCTSQHPILKTRERQLNSFNYSCLFCKNTFHPYTERYSCQLCKINSCLRCGQDNLQDMSPVTSAKLCELRHELELVRKSPKLQFCRICSLYLQGYHFKCKDSKCGYYLCVDCGLQTKSNSQ